MKYLILLALVWSCASAKKKQVDYMLKFDGETYVCEESSLLHSPKKHDKVILEDCENVMTGAKIPFIIAFPTRVTEVSENMK